MTTAPAPTSKAPAKRAKQADADDDLPIALQQHLISAPDDDFVQRVTLSEDSLCTHCCEEVCYFCHRLTMMQQCGCAHSRVSDVQLLTSRKLSAEAVGKLQALIDAVRDSNGVIDKDNQCL
mgnify:CR=1 FL=1